MGGGEKLNGKTKYWGKGTKKSPKIFHPLHNCIHYIVGGVFFLKFWKSIKYIRPKNNYLVSAIPSIKKRVGPSKYVLFFYFVFTPGHIKRVSWLIYQWIKMKLNSI